jgi:hypothetical protein
VLDDAEIRAVLVAFALLIGVATASEAAADAPAPYARGATQSCFMALPNTVAGLPPTTPPVPPTLFVYALAGHDISTAEGFGPRPRAHRQLGVWYGDKQYQGIILSFFKSAEDARASLKTLAWLYGGKLVRNVVITWDQKRVPDRRMRRIVLSCLRSEPGEHPAASTTPKATLATFAGRWGGHTRRLSVTSTGRGSENADDGCCTRVYELTLQILSVTGSLTRATAVYRVESWRHDESGLRRLHAGEIGKILLKDGIVTNTLTSDFFCSDPAWGATGACGA